MNPDNPFPLEIEEKQDSASKLQLLQHIASVFKLSAQEFNQIVKAVQYLHSSTLYPPVYVNPDDFEELPEGFANLVLGFEAGDLIKAKTAPITLFSQHTTSETTGATGIDLFQPTFGLSIFTIEDMQENSRYQGSFLFELINNNTGIDKVITLFGVEIFNDNLPAGTISGAVDYSITFHDEDGDDIDYTITAKAIINDSLFIKSHTGTINKTASAAIELTITGHTSDEITVYEPFMKRC